MSGAVAPYESWPDWCWFCSSFPHLNLACVVDFRSPAFCAFAAAYSVSVLPLTVVQPRCLAPCTLCSEWHLSFVKFCWPLPLGAATVALQSRRALSFDYTSYCPALS